MKLITKKDSEKLLVADIWLSNTLSDLMPGASDEHPGLMKPFQSSPESLLHIINMLNNRSDMTWEHLPNSDGIRITKGESK